MLSDINSSHTQRWACELIRKGIDVAIFSMSKPSSDWYLKENIQLINSATISKNKFNSNTFSKASYLKLLPQLRKAIADFQPQIVHAHYASSYGFLGALSGFHPYVISAWGSDVMDFPKRNAINRNILKYNFKKADQIFATSEILVKTISKFSKKTIAKIPFGINTDYFKPIAVERIFSPDAVVIGVVKSLEEIYGIDIVMKAFKKVVENEKDESLKLLIVGGGSKENDYKALVKELNLTDSIVFTGKIEYDQVLNYHNMIDIFVNVSRNESFGVAVLEASACEKPVIASKVGGLTEVVLNDETGLLVESENIDDTANAILRLVKDRFLCKQMGVNGRKFVKHNYEFNNNVNDMIAIYQQLIRKS
jgi:glycosyltransferase involved in cell wall biosynthesis